MLLMKILPLILSIIIIGSCTSKSQYPELEKAKTAFAAKDFKKAVKHYKMLIYKYPKEQVAIDASLKVAEISMFSPETLKQAIEHYEYVRSHAIRKEDKIRALEALGMIYFEKLSEYPKAILEFSRMIEITENIEKKMQARFMVARSYFFLNKMYQAEIELKEIIDQKIGDTSSFQAFLLLANIKHSEKNYQEAIRIYNEILEEFPELSIKENVKLNLAVCYEDNFQFKEAIEVLKSLKSTYSDKEFIDLKIVRLEERILQLPGAKGFKK